MVPPQPRFWNWTFKGFRDRRGNRIQIWYDKQLPEVHAEFDLMLKALRNRSHIEWSTMGRSKDLRGKQNRGLIELRFEVNRVPYRPIGMFAGGQQTFTVLTVAMKFDFDAQCATARERKALVESNPGEYANESNCLFDITRKA